jgi:hypothetical protein
MLPKTHIASGPAIALFGTLCSLAATTIVPTAQAQSAAADTNNAASWSSNPRASVGHSEEVVVRPKNDEIMVIGGLDENGLATRSAEILDPHKPANGWSPAAHVPIVKSVTVGMSGTALANGTVLIAGGEAISSANSPGDGCISLLYDPANDSWVQTGTIPETFCYNFNTPIALLDNGRALFNIGIDTAFVLGVYGLQSAKAYLYHPDKATWTLTTMNHPHLGSNIEAVPGGGAYVVGNICAKRSSSCVRGRPGLSSS